MNNVFCTNCNKKVSYSLRKSIIKKYKGYLVNVEENIAVCDECGKDIFVPVIEDDNFKRLYEKYREMTGTITPLEITNFREKYHLSQREFVALLGWGKMTINRYERGSLPSKSHSDMLKNIIYNEEILKQRAAEAYEAKRINDITYNSLVNSFKSSRTNIARSLLEIELSHEESILNGFRKFDVDRVENLISYIADKADSITKFSLNMYLWYIDSENFKESVISITGLSYIKQKYGPAIENKGCDLLIYLLDERYYIDETEDISNNTTQVRIISKKNYDMSFFNDDEKKVIDKVIGKFKSLTNSEILCLIYQENLWIETNDNCIDETKKMGGEVIQISAGSGSYFNPLELDSSISNELILMDKKESEFREMLKGCGHEQATYTANLFLEMANRQKNSLSDEWYKRIVALCHEYINS